MHNTLDLKYFQIFCPYAYTKYQQAQNGNQRFAYYTTAETAMSIIRNQEVWMRNANCMNDFMEVDYGLNCLAGAYKSPTGDKFKQILDAAFPEINDEIKNIFNSWVDYFRSDTFLTCFSEHQDSEDAIGRLSMWRAYGKDSGVALVFNNKQILAASDALKVYSQPVVYLNQQDTERQLGNIIENIKREYDFIKRQSRDSIKNYVFNTFKFAVLCIKHPGFTEEKEWRVVYSPANGESNHLVKAIHSIDGIPQQIFKIPLKEIPEENYYASIPQLIDRIIIGPSQYPIQLRKSFIELLAEVGVWEPEKKVVMSDIPLRC